MKNKTLYICVYDSFSVENKKNVYKVKKVDKPVFIDIISKTLEILFSVVGNYSRPPTIFFNNLIYSKTI